MSEKIYDHTQGNVLDACGYSEEQMGELVNKANNIAKSVMEGEEAKTSKVIEKYSEELNTQELSLLLYTLQDQLAHFKNQVMSTMVGQVGED